MIVRLAEPASARVDEPADFSRFNVVAPGLDDAAAAKVLDAAGAGSAADQPGHVVVGVAWLRSAAGAGQNADWTVGFGLMTDYAHKKGWMTPDGSGILAHLETE